MLILLFILMCPFLVSAQEDEELVVVAQAVKYYKTTTVLSSSEVMRNAGLGETSSFTEEITEEEFNNAEQDPTVGPRISYDQTIETNYKRLTSEIIKNNTIYRYQATLFWKTIPSTRSYDIIGIGHYADVGESGGVVFIQDYCYGSSDCYDSTMYYSKTGANGSGATFNLPTGSVTYLEQTLYFDVEKVDSSDTIYYQEAAADYSHATRTISYANAKKFSLNLGGLVLNSSIESYYDTTPTATAVWEGTW